ncbi:MAG: SDR family NAD(P)-dependent oxidoreductase [Eggerthellaceae bacterium]|nr:SDR family NAD(P)-dependent oxidoreductase [Eggerthellaceae bacterium]
MADEQNSTVAAASPAEKATAPQEQNAGASGAKDLEQQIGERTEEAVVRRKTIADADQKKIAVVTGASSGMGREFALQIDLMQVVDEIWIIARNVEKLQEVANELTTPARVVSMDLTDRSDIDKFSETLQNEQPNVYYLINSAGFGKFGDWQTISDSAADSMIDLTCRAVVDMTRACLPYMERGSHIIQVASSAAFMPLPHMNVYAATKAFVLRYTRALRWELSGTGVTATALCPTWVKTGFESVARSSGGGHDVRHLMFAQKPSVVVSWALCGNKCHFAVVTASPQAWFLRWIGKFVPNCISMLGWEILRRI